MLKMSKLLSMGFISIICNKIRIKYIAKNLQSMLDVPYVSVLHYHTMMHN